MRALAGELSKRAALAGTALRTVAAVLHAGLHIQLHRHTGLAVLKGCRGQQPLTFGSLKIGRQEFSQLFTPLFPPLRAKGSPTKVSECRFPESLGSPHWWLTCSEQDSGSCTTSGSPHSTPGLLIFCMFPNSMALKCTPGETAGQ